MRYGVYPLLLAALVGGTAATGLSARAASAPAVQWLAGVQQGQVVHVRRGQTVTASAAFHVSAAPLYYAQVKRTLSAYAQSQGVSMTVTGTNPGQLTALQPNQTVTVRFTISAAANAYVATYNADLHVNGSAAPTAAANHVASDLDFVIAVDHMATTVTWLPAAPGTNGVSDSQTLVVRQGTTLVRTATFTTVTPLYGVSVQRTLLDYAKDHGIQVTVVGQQLVTGAGGAITGGAVTFVVSAAPGTRVATYHGDLHVDGSLTPGGPMAIIPDNLHLTLSVARAH
jgi:hypothetical protein